MMRWFRRSKKKQKSGFMRWVEDGCRGGERKSHAQGTFVFPALYRGPTYDLDTFPNELLIIRGGTSTPWISRPSSSASMVITDMDTLALLIHGNPRNNPTHLMIVFHANGIDLGMASVFYRRFIRILAVHLLIVEYPQYGRMKGSLSCKSAMETAKTAYDFAVSSEYGLGVDPSKIIILGHGIGTGVASYIATFPCSMLILISAFTSFASVSSSKLLRYSGWLHTERDAKGKKSANSNSNNNNEHGNENENENDNNDTDTDTTTIPAALATHKKRKHQNKNINCAENNEKLIPINADADHQQTETQTNEIESDVFDNLAQIPSWKCNHVMLFHGVRDKVIPCKHSELIQQRIQDCRPEIDCILMAIDGVGFCDVSVSYVGLRVYMAHETLLCSSSGGSIMDICQFAQFNGTPPQYDFTTNRMIPAPVAEEPAGVALPNAAISRFDARQQQQQRQHLKKIGHNDNDMNIIKNAHTVDKSHTHIRGHNSPNKKQQMNEDNKHDEDTDQLGMGMLLETNGNIEVVVEHRQHVERNGSSGIKNDDDYDTQEINDHEIGMLLETNIANQCKANVDEMIHSSNKENDSLPQRMLLNVVGDSDKYEQIKSEHELLSIEYQELHRKYAMLVNNRSNSNSNSNSNDNVNKNDTLSLSSSSPHLICDTLNYDNANGNDNEDEDANVMERVVVHGGGEEEGGNNDNENVIELSVYQQRFQTWLTDTIQLPQYLHLFAENEMSDMRYIQYFNDNCLQSIGISKSMHRKLIIKRSQTMADLQLELDEFLNANVRLKRYHQELEKHGILTIKDLQLQMNTKAQMQHVLQLRLTKQVVVNDLWNIVQSTFPV